MNKTAIKNFAILARVQLIEASKQRAYEYEVIENGETKLVVDAIGGRLLSKDEKEQRTKLIEQIRQKGYAQVMEEAAYTWFNRFIALRFMEVNGYLPSKVRVFTDETGAFKPEILKQAMSVELDGLDRSKVLDLLDKQNNEELYKYLLITQCNALNTGLPYMFEKIANWTELLFPPNLLRTDSVLGQMVSSIPEEDWTDAEQIIGWLYQYYNSELKDETFTLLKKNVKISKERIPAATQLFTPDWIVRYMVENSLGRLWYEGHKDFDKSQWKYYLDEANQEPDVENQLQVVRVDYARMRPEEIKVIDPCMGSGHILVYAFDVLMQIYTSAGWSERDATKSILENNLYGLDIDDRAGQLAYFAVMMKARKYSRRILNGDVKPNVLSIQESNWMTDEFITYVAGKDTAMKSDLIMIRKTFKDAKEYGSILVVPEMNYNALYERLDILRRSYAENLFETQHQKKAIELLLPLLKQAQIMAQKYDVVVTNPPYMGSSGMSAKLSEFVKGNYPDSKSDLFAVFIECCGRMTKKNGYQAMITQHTWMFIASYELLREKMISKQIVNMLHLGARAFDEIAGEVVQTAAFIVWNGYLKKYNGIYCRLLDANSEKAKEDAFLSRKLENVVCQDVFVLIPRTEFIYWVSDAMLNVFASYRKVRDGFTVRNGLTTGDNNTFLRLWFEIEKRLINVKWFPCNKGGSFRRWYGNRDYLIDWENDGERLKSFTDEKTGKLRSTLRNIDYNFKPAVVVGHVVSGDLPFRIVDKGSVFESAVNGIFPINDSIGLNYLLAALNSRPCNYISAMLSPTLGVSPEDILNIPISTECKEIVENKASENISISMADWNAFETSWDFKRHPLV